ncbi:Gfo/Idh/MocA family protein [Nocardioides sp. Kera G14]|uniref:Gfo/Idh/MocA family protein n=1 Tax=Nocardioides sp. Kera G14 TaxID=2884264 RepID=UPI001D108B75|nr:Gfo/Idh/MocA family oxidoreductase [Nocardioides sp. Kera G14]UDY23172.1 Gfo/Idh/MocA family oxidoreductase [Nocardioides sp. Kera G14]
MTATPVRWGILATGKIAHQFAADLLLVPDARLVAVGSRSLEKAQAFADQYADHGPVRAHGSYEDLVSDEDVDVVYIATPHALHLDDTKLALEAGKHVLCEKPLTLRTSDAEELFALAAKQERLLMEAMWTACHPTIHALAARLKKGEFGTPRHLHAELGFVVPPDPTSRMLDPRLGAGALLDMGIYPLTFAHLMLGEAEQLTGLADVVHTEHGDYDNSIVMTGRYPGGALATMVASMTSWSSRRAAIATDQGRIDVDDFHHPSRVTFTPNTAKAEWTDPDDAAGAPVLIEPETAVIGRGYAHEAIEVNACLQAGRTESSQVPSQQTLTIMRQMDALREETGIVYPEA